MNNKFTNLMAVLCWMLSLSAGAQSTQYTTKGISKNPDKFLGNITSRYQMDYDGIKYSSLWNQVTPENESKWGSVEGNRGNFNWGCDTPFNYAKSNGFTYKFHAFIWGAQYPNWFPNLSITDRYNAIVNWVDHVKGKYKHLPMIDVVNEAVGTHQAGNPMMKESLGGGGKTGYDWLIKAFELAYERFPNSILIYNDFNTFQWNTDEYIDLVRSLRDAGAPIDAYGCQAHDLKNFSLANLKTVDSKIQTALKMPMYITEYDIQNDNDEQQRNDYKNHIPYFWEKDYCAGITLWGWVYGCTWNENQSGIIKNKQDRLAMTWLRSYMASDAAKNAKSPFPGMIKRVGVYVKPRDLKVAKGDVLPIKVRTFITDEAKKEKEDIAIDKVELYVGSNRIATMTEEPYIADYEVPESEAAGIKTLKAIVYTNDDNTYERYSRVEVLGSTVKREPYNETPVELPGTINCGEYDKGASGVSYNNGVGRNATTVTKNDGWMEYTVDVKEPGLYSFDAEVAAVNDGGVFHLSEYGFDNLTYFTNFIEVPSTGSATNFQSLHGVLTQELTAGRHVICLNTDKGGFYIKSLTFKPYEQNKNISVKVASVSATTVFAGEPVTIDLTASVATDNIASVKVYANDLLIGTLTEAPYVLEYAPAAKGNYTITAIATDAEGKENKSTTNKTLKVKGLRSSYKGQVIELPGTVEAENFDVGGEDVTYHDSNTECEGSGASYRSDVGGVDIKNVSGVGYTIGYTHSGEWLEYTIDVKEAGYYDYDAYVSCGGTGASFKLTIETDNASKNLSETINVPQTGNGTWNNYVPVHGRTLISLAEGKHTLRINVTGDNGDIDKVVFKHLNIDESLKLTLTSDPASATVNENTTLKATTTATNIQSVNFYVDNRLLKNVTEAPFEVTYKPTTKGTYKITAEAITNDGKISKLYSYNLKVNSKRSPYGATAIAIPGIIQAENFDKGGEGLSFHDSDSKDEGDATNKRTDGEGVDLVKGNSGTAIGYTAKDEWLEYTVNVKEAGKYSYEVTVSSGTTNSGFRISLVNANGTLTALANVSVPQTANNDWGTYKTVTGDFLKELSAGQQILRITITGANCNIDKVKLICVEPNAINDVTIEPTLVNGRKVFENGQFVIYRNGKRYNALGVELE